MKLVIDFPGLDEGAVTDIADLLRHGGYDAGIVGKVTAEDSPGDQLIMAVEPLEPL